MKQTNLTVNPIVGTTTQKGTLPSDTKAQYFYISREIVSKNKRTAKYLKLYSVIMLVVIVLLLLFQGHVRIVE